MTKRTCLTCAYEPEWRWWVPLNPLCPPSDVGLCRYTVNSKVVRAKRLPTGSSIYLPMVEKPKPKKNCPAWEGKP